MEDLFSAAPAAASPTTALPMAESPSTPATAASDFVMPVMESTSPIASEGLGIELTSQSSFEESPLRAWEKQHAQELTEKSRAESERRQKLLAQARQDLDEFNADRAKKAEAKERQNKEEEALFRETQQRQFEGDVWAQAARVTDIQKKSGEKDVARMRQVLSVLKH